MLPPQHQLSKRAMAISDVRRSEGPESPDGRDRFIEFVATQYGIERERFERHQGRLALFQTSPTVPLVALGAVGAAASSNAEDLSRLFWIILAVSAILLLLAVVLAVFGGRTSGIAAMSAQDIRTWINDSHWERPDRDVQRYLLDHAVEAIEIQEKVNDRLVKVWLAASICQLSGLILAIGLVVTALLP